MSAPSNRTKYLRLQKPFALESGERLDGVQVAYRTWGRLDASRGNAVVVCHALTGNADADEWWSPLFGRGRALDPSRDFVVCSNVLGSCYGTTGPANVNPRTGLPHAASFPSITIRDIVALQKLLVEHLGVRRVKLVIGGSLGGMQVLEWALAAPELVEAIAPIATSGRHSAWTIGISEAQRQAIYADPDWRGGFYPVHAPPRRGLAVARMIAMATYRSHASFEARFGRTRDENGGFAIESYLQHHGEKLVARFDANAYVTLTRAMDAHDVGRGRGSYERALRSIAQPTLVVSIDTDVLYPPTEQEELGQRIPDARLRTIASPHGHDAFLIEMDALNDAVVEFRKSVGRAHDPRSVGCHPEPTDVARDAPEERNIRRAQGVLPGPITSRFGELEEETRRHPELGCVGERGEGPAASRTIWHVDDLNGRGCTSLRGSSPPARPPAWDDGSTPHEHGELPLGITRLRPA